MNNLFRTLLFSIVMIMAVQFGTHALGAERTSPFDGEWFESNNLLSFYSDSSEDWVGTYAVDEMDGYNFQMYRSKIVSRGLNTITFEDYGQKLTLIYNPSEKSVTVKIDGDSVSTFHEDTNKLQYWYISENYDFMNDSAGSHVIGKVRAGDRYHISDVLKDENGYKYIRRPVDTNGWVSSYVLVQGVKEPIKYESFPLKWEYDDGRAGYSLTFRKLDDKNILAIYQWQAYMGENSATNYGSIGYLGTIDGNRMAFRKQKNPANGNSGFTIMQKPVEMTFIPGYNGHLYEAVLIFDGMRFSPVFDND